LPRQEELHPELRNIAHDLSEEELTEIGATCMEEFEADLETRQEWLEMHNKWTRQYFQKDRPIDPPWEGASSESLPLLAEACNQFHSRAYQAMFPNRRIVQCIPIGKKGAASRARADRVAQHMTWQLVHRDTKYKRYKDRLLLSVPLHGS